MTLTLLRKPLWLPLIVLTMAALAGCASNKPYQITLMPAPDVFADGTVELLGEEDPIESIPYDGILYATDREPAKEGDKARYYRNERGHVLRVGVASIEVKDQEFTWEEARRISLLKNRSNKYPLRVTKASEIGVLKDSFNTFIEPEVLDPDPERPAREFAAMIDAKLAQSENKDIYIYLHGYKVVFDNPILVAAELWHFLGYDGVFIAYSWPSTPKTLAYVSDLETAAYAARNLRLFLRYLARETQAERIHIVAYSAGTRVAITALAQLALMNAAIDRQAIQERLRLGHIILVGSDFDISLFGGYIVDGLMKVPGDLAIYTSKSDKALGVSRKVFARQRLGQTWDKEEMGEIVADYLRRTDNLTVIDVSDAEQADAGNGHAYFRKSPWASSDILISLKYGLEPGERGLVTHGDWPVWQFPEDYPRRLKATLKSANPALFGEPAAD
ncbi:MAG TPA: alpha/beta hydrolase [Chromatiales bacterium]|nr:alpha/beta hydrolase [Chromatiales bacterium]